MGETIEELQVKLKEAKRKDDMKIELAKLEEAKRKDDIQKAKLAERITTRKNKEEAAAKKVQAKNQIKIDKQEKEDNYNNMVSDFLKENPIFYDNNKIYWAWNWSIRSFEMVDDTTIMRKLTQSAGIKITKGSEKFEFLENIRQDARGLNPKPLPPNFIQFKDKVIDILTNDEFYADPTYLYVSPIPHNLGGSTSTPRIDELLGDWVHKQNVITLYEIIAYCMYKDYPISKEFFLIGEGRNGKSQFEAIINKFIGNNNITTSSLDKLTNSQFASSKLYKKCACIISEIDGDVIKKTSTLKALTGNDPMDGEMKGKDAFDFINYAKIIISSNILPETLDKTDGFYTRTLIIDFPNKFKDTGIPIYETIPDWEYENLGRKLILILNNLLKRGSFTNDGSIESKRRRFEGKSNPISEFINQSYIIDINNRIKMEDFQTNFNVWRASRQIPVISNNKIFANIRAIGYDTKQITERGIKVQYILGLGYKPIEEDEFGLDEYEKQFEPNDGW